MLILSSHTALHLAYSAMEDALVEAIATASSFVKTFTDIDAAISNQKTGKLILDATQALVFFITAPTLHVGT